MCDPTNDTLLKYVSRSGVRNFCVSHVQGPTQCEGEVWRGAGEGCGKRVRGMGAGTGVGKGCGEEVRETGAGKGYGKGALPWRVTAGSYSARLFLSRLRALRSLSLSLSNSSRTWMRRMKGVSATIIGSSARRMPSFTGPSSASAAIVVRRC